MEADKRLRHPPASGNQNESVSGEDKVGIQLATEQRGPYPARWLVQQLQHGVVIEYLRLGAAALEHLDRHLGEVGTDGLHTGKGPRERRQCR